MLEWLEDNQYDFVKTNYWIGYRLAFESNEAVRFMIFSNPSKVRISKYELEGWQSNPDAPYVVVPAQARKLKRALTIQGYQYKTVHLSGYEVIYDYTSPYSKASILSSDLYSVFASDSSEALAGINDQKMTTRWGSGRPQSNDMWLKIVLSQPQEVFGLKYFLGHWVHDYPRGLVVDVIDEEGKTHRVLRRRDYNILRFAIENDSVLSFRLPDFKIKEVILRQTGEDDFFDWSVAELELYEASDLG